MNRIDASELANSQQDVSVSLEQQNLWKKISIVSTSHKW